MSGIADPLRQLPDMHAVLDVVEVLLTEAMTREELSTYYRDMYADNTPVSATSSAPAGFTREEQKASFDAFRSFAGGVE